MFISYAFVINTLIIIIITTASALFWWLVVGAYNVLNVYSMHCISVSDYGGLFIPLLMTPHSLT